MVGSKCHDRPNPLDGLPVLDWQGNDLIYLRKIKVNNIKRNKIYAATAENRYI